MTAPDLFSRERAVVKAHLVQSFADALEPLLEETWAGRLSVNDAERRLWPVLLAIGSMVLTALFAAMCRDATEQFLALRDGQYARVSLRLEDDYWSTLTTTLGPLSFPLFAVRLDGQVVVPARSLFPLRKVCDSSLLCLEWESALAADHPFRHAAKALGFFTHGAVSLAATTIERHALVVASRITQEWLYQTPDKIREILLSNATRDKASGRPLLYVSTDAHALRRFVDPTWAAPWKMINGIRLWCIDKSNGQTIHLGGEYTWGDCHEVVARLVSLQQSGHLPKDGHYGEGLRAQLVVVTDGQPWIAERVLPLFEGAMTPLDPYHVVEQVTDAARKAFPKNEAKVARVVKAARRAVGMKTRRSRAKNRKGKKCSRHRHRHPPFTGSARELLDELEPMEKQLRGEGRERWRTLLGYVRRNEARMNYGELRQRGICIGSGAMESLHRQASQLRLKRPGCRWTLQASEAILAVRMLALVGRWDEFWAQPDLATQLAATGGRMAA